MVEDQRLKSSSTTSENCLPELHDRAQERNSLSSTSTIPPFEQIEYLHLPFPDRFITSVLCSTRIDSSGLESKEETLIALLGRSWQNIHRVVCLAESLVSIECTTSFGTGVTCSLLRKACQRSSSRNSFTNQASEKVSIRIDL